MNPVPRSRRRIVLATLMTLSALASSSAQAAIDVLQVVVEGAVATEGGSIGAFAYNPLDDTMFVSSFGADGAMRKVVNVSTAPTSSIYVTNAQLQLYLRDGDPDRGVGTPIQSGILFNPVTLGSGDDAIEPYQMAVIAEAGTTFLPGTGSGNANRDPHATKRFYRYSLETIPEGGDARDVYTTLATMADMHEAIDAPFNSTTNQGRQMAWSGNGQWLYFADSSSEHGGIWKLDPLSGDINRLSAGGANTEPAVVTAEGVDTIYFRGGEDTNNVGGIDKFTYDGTTASERSVAVSVAELRNFLEADEELTPTVFAMTADAAGNVYFSHGDSSPERRGIFKWDAEGRLAKLVSHAERDIAITGELGVSPAPNANTLRMQLRDVTHPTAGDIQQLLYAENVTDGITGVYLFETGDFDRDGALDGEDLAIFGAALQPRGTVLTSEDHYKFDLNANSVVDWKDVKILQQFAQFPDGDVNFDGTLNFIDLDVLGANYFTASAEPNKTWTLGDIASVDPLYAADAADANVVNQIDVDLFAHTWLDVLEQPIALEDIDARGYAGQFYDDVLAAFGLATTTLAGDYDVDGDVDGNDFLLWQRQLGATGVDPVGSGADGNADGAVDALDLAVWREAFGAGGATPEGAAAVPEPGAAALTTLSLLALVAQRRRRSAAG